MTLKDETAPSPSDDANDSDDSNCTACYCCILVFLIFATVTILLVMFVISGSVTLEMAAFNVNNNSLLKGSNGSNGFNVSANLALTVTNNNFYDVSLSNIRVRMYHPLYGYYQQSLGFEALDDTTLLFKRRDTVFLSLGAIIIYDETYDPNQAFMKNLLLICTTPPKAGTTEGKSSLNLRVRMDADSHMWDGDGWFLRERVLSMPCLLNSQ